MTEKTKHPLANVLGWIAEGSIVEYRISNGRCWQSLDTSVPFSLFHDFEYRKKTVPKYRVLYINFQADPLASVRFGVSDRYYTSLEVFKQTNTYLSPIQLIEESKIET